MYPRALIPLLIAVGGLLVPAAATASSACSSLPATVRPSTSDFAAFQEEGRLIVTVRRGAPVRDLKAYVRRGSRTVATGSRPGAARTGHRVALAMSADMRAQRHTIVLTGRRAGCPRRTRSTRTWTFEASSLPVRASRTSAYAADYTTSMSLVLRSVARLRVERVDAALFAADGTRVTVGARTTPFTSHAVLELRLAQPLQPGAYRLRLSGIARGVRGRQVWEESIVLQPGTEAEAPKTPNGIPTPAGPASGLREQRVTVDWSDGDHEGRDRGGFVVPGIGYGEVTCRPDTQWIRFFPQDLRRESALVSWVKKDWGEWREQAVREAIYERFTGPEFNEGFNKFTPTEARSTGSIEGIFVDRGPIGGPGGPGAAPTTVRLAWSWDFSDGARSRCAVRATFTSDAAPDQRPMARGLSVTWRGAGSAAGRDGASAIVPGAGRLDVSCQPAEEGNRWLSVTGPESAEITTREGSEEASVPLGAPPVATRLPGNGMLRLAMPDGSTVLASSRWKVNDPEPAGNHCFVAAQYVAP